MRLGIATCSEKPEITRADALAAGVAARRLGCEIVPVPWDLPAQPQVDALVVRSTWGYHHDLARFEKWLRGLAVPVLNPVSLMLGNLNKRYLGDLEARGVPIVPTVFFGSAEEVSRLRWPELVLKPTVSASSHLTFRVPAREAAAAATQVLTRSEGMAQPFVEEIVSAGELSAIYHKAFGAPPRFSHGVRKLPARGDFRVQAEFGGVVEAYVPSPAAAAFCEKVLRAIEGEWLYARVDFVETAAGPLLCELELVEPYLFYDQPRADLEGFANALASHLG